MQQLPDGTYQLDGIDIFALVLGPIMVLFGFLLSPFFLFAGIGLLLLTAWATSKIKLLAIILTIVLLFLIGTFNLLLNPMALVTLVFGYTSGFLLPLVFTGTISILGITCGIKKSDSVTHVASIAFNICAFICAVILSLPPAPPLELFKFLWIFLANYVVIQFGYIIVFSLFYYAVHYSCHVVRNHFQQLRILDRWFQHPGVLTEEERQQYENIFGNSPPSGSSPPDNSSTKKETEIKIKEVVK